MLKTALSLCALALLGGCADLTHFKQDLHNPTFGVSVDIKQRMVFRNQGPEKPAGSGKNTEWDRVCAEPSPDAISALGASLGASLLRPTGSQAQVAAALNESGAYVGLRTQSIQLMRDAMYRACEAYMSDAIDKAEYLQLQRRFQAQVVGLLAIEQLTGTLAAPPAAVYTNASAAAGGGASAEADRLAEARKQLAGQKTKEDAAKKALDAAKTKATKLEADAAKFKDKKEDALTDAEKQTKVDKAAADKAVEAAEGQAKLDAELTQLYQDALKVAEEDYNNAKNRVRASNTAGATLPPNIAARAPSDGAVTAIKDGVIHIVDSVFNAAFDDTVSRCLVKLLDTSERNRPSLLEVCSVLAAREDATEQIRTEKLRNQAAPPVAAAEPPPPAAGSKPGDKPTKPTTASSAAALPLGKAEALAAANSRALRTQELRSERSNQTAEMLRKAQQSMQAPQAPASAASAAKQ